MKDDRPAAPAISATPRAGPASGQDVERHPEQDQGRPPPGQPTLQCDLEIVNKKGLHARASAKFVQLVEGFDAEVRVTRGNETVGGTSIMGLMMLAAGTGTTIHVEAWGPQAEAVVAALTALVSGRFGEED